MIEFLKHTKDYLKKAMPEFRAFGQYFTCPICKKYPPTCHFMNEFTLEMACNNCNDVIGDLATVISKKNNCTREEAFNNIKEYLNLDLTTPQERDILFSFYKENGFDLVPIVKNEKYPIEKDWTNKIHKDVDEWITWVERGLNIGAKTGKCSNLVVIDIDSDTIPEVFKSINTCYQKTNKGCHYFFQYDPDLPKTRIDDLKIDIETDGGQVVIAPSTIDGVKRILKLSKVLPLPKEVKQFLKSKLTTSSSVFSRPVDNTPINVGNIGDGSRHTTLMQLGGILRQQLNINQSGFVLDILNRMVCKPPLDKRDFNALVGSLSKYTDFDDKELAGQVLRYLQIVEEATARDVTEGLGFKTEKVRIDKVLSYLIKEGYLIKKARLYHLIKKADWKEEWMKEAEEYPVKIPYIYDAGIIRNGDMILIGGKSGQGKSHIAINMIKLLVEQGVTPHYISLESGNRFALIAQQLGLKEGDFKWCVHFNPENIELEENTITIIDWLLPKDYANTDKVYEHFAQQLNKQGGILIVFCQLRDNGDFFAKDMIKFFPSIVAKFLYETDAEGLENRERSYFEIVKVRESKQPRAGGRIPCVYNWQTKQLVRKEDYKEHEG